MYMYMISLVPHFQGKCINKYIFSFAVKINQTKKMREMIMKMMMNVMRMGKDEKVLRVPGM